MFCLATKREPPTQTVHTNTPTLDSATLWRQKRAVQPHPIPLQRCCNGVFLGTTIYHPPRVFLTLLDEKRNEKQPSLQITLLNVCVCVAFLYICLFFSSFFCITFYFSPPSTAELWAFFGVVLPNVVLFSLPYLYAIYHNRVCVCRNLDVMKPKWCYQRAGRKTSLTNPESYQQKCTPV